MYLLSYAQSQVLCPDKAMELQRRTCYSFYTTMTHSQGEKGQLVRWWLNNQIIMAVISSMREV